MTKQRKFKTEDGYSFYVQPDGKVTDTADPEAADMTFESLELFLETNPTATEFLGPVPTVKQMELLKKLMSEGAHIAWYSGIRGPDSARLIIDPNDFNNRETVNTKLLWDFHTWGWVEKFGDPSWAWRNNEYRITERGRKVVELGKVRK